MTLMGTKNCMVVSYAVEGDGISDCGGYAHQANNEATKIWLRHERPIGKIYVVKEARDIVLVACQENWDRAKQGRWTPC